MRRTLVAACVGLVVAAGGCGGDEDEPERATTTAPKPASGEPEPAPSEAAKPGPGAETKTPPERAVAPAEPAELRPLPDGVFRGGVRTDEVTGDVRFTVRGGVVVSAEATLGRGDAQPVRIPLRVAGAPHADGLVLSGHQEGSYVRVEGRFRDDEVVLGDLRGGIQRRVVEGPWYAMRR